MFLSLGSEVIEIRTRGKEDSRAGGEDLMILGWHCLYLMRYFAGQPAWFWGTERAFASEVVVADDLGVPIIPFWGEPGVRILAAVRRAVKNLRGGEVFQAEELPDPQTLSDDDSKMRDLADRSNPSMGRQEMPRIDPEAARRRRAQLRKRQ